jgi:hypothetical protein
VSAQSAAARGRRLAESLMSSACTVFASGEDITDPQTGEVTHARETVWFGPCRVRPAGTQGSDVTAGGAELRRYDFVVSLPFAVTDVIKGHRLTITDSPDAALAGRTFEVQDVAAGDTITARRLGCTEVT